MGKGGVQTAPGASYAVGSREGDMVEWAAHLLIVGIAVWSIAGLVALGIGLGVRALAGQRVERNRQ